MENSRRHDTYTYTQQPYTINEDVKENNFTPSVNAIPEKNIILIYKEMQNYFIGSTYYKHYDFMYICFQTKDF